MLENNIKEVKERIENCCNIAGRNTDEITLVAVSKKFPIKIINQATQLGIKDFGENKAQELKLKAVEYKSNINWHFIGHLQRNKVKDVIQFAEIIHSVDSKRLADEINKRAANISKIQRILFEINTGGEESKYGLESFDDIVKLTEYCSGLTNLKIEGLMTMAPYTKNEGVIKNCFVSLRETLNKLNSRGFNLNQLSMGMTNDYEIAIKEGATILRIGTAIFGERIY